MRISENLKTSFLLNNLNRTMERLIKSQQDLSTSKRIHKPSDDPGGSLKLLRLKSYLSRYERYQKNTEDAEHWLVAAESSLTDLEGILTQVNSILIRASSDTVDKTERENLGRQLAALWDQVIQVANQKHGDKYLFGGTHNETQPFTASRDVSDESFMADHDTAVELENVGISQGTVTVTTTDGATTFTEDVDYTIDYDLGKITVLSTGSMTDGDDFLISYETDDPNEAVLNPAGTDGDILRKIDEGLTLKINVSADDVFGGTESILDIVKQAIIALRRSDRDAIKDSMGKIEEKISATSKIHNGDIGVKIKRLEDLELKLSTDVATYERMISDIEDADIASVMVQLQSDQMVYQAALRTASNIMQESLLDFLK